MECPGFTMGKVRQISADLDGSHCTNNDSYSRIDPFKNSYNAIVPMGKAMQKQPKTGDCRIGDSYCRIERTRLLEWH